MPQNYTSQIAEMRRANPDTFPDDASAMAWGTRYYGWGSPATDTAAPGAGTNPDIAPPFTAPPWVGPGVPRPTLGTLPAFQGPADFTYGAFQAPGAEGMYADPGYQYRLNQGVRAADASAAARGTLRGGAQQAALTRLGQDYGSQEYGNVWDRALGAYKTNYLTARDINNTAYDRAGNTYDRNRLERDASYGAQTGDWNRDVDERTAAYNAAMTAATAQYAPNLLSWNRQYDRDVFNQNLAQRQAEYGGDNAYRWGTWRGDDEYRRWLADLQNRQFLAGLGNY